MTTLKQTAFIFIFSSIALSGVIQVVNLMGPVQLINVEESYLDSFFVSKNDLKILQGETAEPDPILQDIVPADVLGFLAPAVIGVSFVLQVLFTIFASWSLVLFAIVDSVGVDSTFLAPIIPGILMMNVFSFIYIIITFKEGVPFQ